ncbi:MAG: hypothetical protein HYT61_02240 [Candidatus Yanofskybacteria bacterium]|nr:hypothetical protein [Candidatus Yanofskybacteria bacterium]
MTNMIVPSNRQSSKFSVSSYKRNFQSPNDRSLKENMKALNASKEELANNNKLVKKALDLPTDRTRSLMAQVLHFIIPRKFYDSLPDGMVKFIAEEYDVLELIERLMRTNVNNTQDALRNIAACAQAKAEDLDNLAADIATAQKENWDAQQLQHYMAERAGVPIYEEVARLLDKEFSILDPEEREKRKIQLLEQLLSNIIIGEELIHTLSKVCSAGLEIFHRGVGQYFDYVNIYRPVAVIRDSAQTMVDMNQSMYASKDAVVATFQASLNAIETAVDAATLVNNYRIASSDLKKLLQTGQSRIMGKLKTLQATTEKLALKPTQTAESI